MTDVFLVREAIVAIFKETVGWLRNFLTWFRNSARSKTLRFRILSASKHHSHSRFNKPILKILPIYRKYILGKHLSQAICYKYIFMLLHPPKWWSKLSNCSQVFYEKAALMNFIGKHLCRSLFFNKVSRLEAKERLPHRCSPVCFTKYFTTLFWENTSGWLLPLNILFYSLRQTQPQKMFSSTLVRQTVNCD